MSFPKIAKSEYPEIEKKKLALMKAMIAKNKQLVLLSDFSELEDIETIKNLIYRPNMHCF